jgi:hypothetical protein
MRSIFKDDTLEKKLKEEGYIVIPFLNQDETTILKDLFLAKCDNKDGQFYASAHDPDLHKRNDVSNAIQSAISKKVKTEMIDMEVLGGSFIVKPKEYNHILQAHQDWNIVDEESFQSFNIWIPLVDTVKENGAIMVMPKSHNWIKSFRHSSIPCAFSPVHDRLLENMLTLNIKAGYALIYNHALIHASHENLSEQARIACASGIKPKEAEMLFYWNNNGVVEEYDSNADFFMNENVFAGPGKLTKRKQIDYNFSEINEQKLFELSGITPLHQAESAEAQVEDTTPLPFWKVYTPLNILREIKYRIFG